jgi:polysaccharide export outer membrane protein
MRFYPLLIVSCFIAGMIACSSCSYRQHQLLFQSQTPIVDSGQNNQGKGTSDYRIKSQDILQIRNLQNPKFIVDETPTAVGSAGGVGGLGQAYQVEEDGNVALPVLGRVHIAGFTRSEAAKQIEGLYRKNPAVKIRLRIIE